MFRIRELLECPICSSRELIPKLDYQEPPKGEKTLPVGRAKVYPRRYHCCAICGHFVSSLELDSSDLYAHDYSVSHYGSLEGIRRSFRSIASLPPEASDNYGRSLRVRDFAREHFEHEPTGLTLLDVGSGLGVFPYSMKRLGFQCTALDPDAYACEHMRQDLGLNALQTLFEKAGDIGRFDVVTLNKVVEHVNDPLSMLEQCRQYLKPGGLLYVEVPDGESAFSEGKEREEFFIEHIHVFSRTSLERLALRADYKVLSLERLREPSSKFTLRAFLRS